MTVFTRTTKTIKPRVFSTGKILSHFRFSSLLSCCFVLMIFLSPGITTAQVSSYGFTASAGTYTPIAGGTVSHASGWDDTQVNSVGIGFTFIFNGVAYTTVSINPNGSVIFQNGSGTASPSYTPISGSGSYLGAVAGWARDLQAQNTAPLGEIRYLSSGGVFTVQWSNSRRYFSTSSNAERFEMQIQLHQNTNEIKIVYGTWSNAISATNTTTLGEVGLRGASNSDYKNLSVTSTGNWASPSAGTSNSATVYYNQVTTGVKPVSGQTYTFSPPPPCSVSPLNQPGSLLLTTVSNTQVSGSFTAATGTPAATGYIVVRYPHNASETKPINNTVYSVGSTLGLGTVVSVGSGTSFTANGLSGNTEYDFYVYSYNNSGCTGAAYNVTAALFGSATTLPTVPATCVTSFSPASGVTGINAGAATLSWSAVSSMPAITGYDVYLSTNGSQVATENSAARVATGITALSYTSSTSLLYNTTYFWKVVPKNTDGSASNCDVYSFTTSGPQPPSCATIIAPIAGAINVPLNQTLSWNAATGAPSVSGYDVYISTDPAAVQSLSPSAKIVSNRSATSMVPSYQTIVFAANTTYYWSVVPLNVVGASSNCTVNSFTTLSSTAVSSTSKGGLWNSPATWASGVVPTSVDNVTIADGAIVTIEQSVTVNSIAIGSGGTGNAVLQWNSANSAFNVNGNLSIESNGFFLPYATGGSGQTINVGGNFTNNGYANLVAATLNFNGSQVGGGSSTQQLNGSGVFEGTSSKGIIRVLQILTSGSVTISSDQSLVVNAQLTSAAGTLNTSGKLALDNTAQLFGRPINTRVASVAVTNMGSGYTGAPTASASGAAAWVASTSVSVGNIRVFGNNVYAVTTGGTTGASGPAHTSGTASNGTATLLWVGNTGTIGNALIATVVSGTQYFYGTNLYTCTTGGAISLTSPPTHTTPTGVTSGAAVFVYAGSAAQVSVNHDAATGTVRSLNLINAGSGYLTSAPSISFIPTNGGTSAAASSTFFQQIAGTASFITQKTPAAVINGGLDIKSDQAVGGISTTNGGAGYSSAPLVGFPVPTGFLNLVTNQGSGYSAAPTVTVSGGTIINSSASPTLPTFTAVVAQGKLISLICTSTGTALYTSLPTLTLTGNATAAFPAGCLPQATAVISNGSIINFNISNPGFGYVAAPSPGYGTGTNAGTFVTAASAPSCRIGLYNLTYNFIIPATNNPESSTGAEIPSNNRVNILTLGSTSSASNFAKVKLQNDLELYAASGALGLQTSTSYGSSLNLNGKTLTFSHTAYSGTGSTGSATNVSFGYVTNGFIKFLTAGGSLTRTFPFDAPFAISTGTGTGLSAGSTISSITVSQTGAPSGSGPRFPVGTRAYKVQVGAGTVLGTSPTVTLSYIGTDSLPSGLQQQYLFVGQSSDLTGPFTSRSTASGGTSTLVIPTASRSTATTGNGPITSADISYFAWINETPAPVITGTYGPFCAAGGQTIDITGTGFTNVSAVTFNGINAASFTINSSTSITAVTPGGITAGTIGVTATGSTGFSSAYTVIATPLFTPSIVPSNGLICSLGGSVTISLNDVGADSYTWTGGPGLDTYTGLNVVATPATSTEYTVTGLISASGCTISKTFQVGVVASASVVPTATPANSCFTPGATVNLNSNLSAGNFSVAPIVYGLATVPANANYLLNKGVLSPSFVAGNTSLDDNGWQGVPIGFNYNFFGNIYNNVAVGTNGVLMFGPVPGYSTTAGQLGQYAYNSTGGVFPNFNNPGNVIAALANDMIFSSATFTQTGTLVSGSANVTTSNTINLAVGDEITGTGIPAGTTIASITSSTVFVMSANATSNGSPTITINEKPSIRFWTEGTAPTRRFIVDYFGGRNYLNAQARSYVQVMLYETTGIVEIHVTKTAGSTPSSTEANSRKTIGLQDATKTIGATAPARSFYTTAITTPEAWRFSPPTNYLYSWSPAASITNPAGSTAIYTVTSPGVKNVSLSVTNPVTGCITNSPLSFTVNPTPVSPTVSGVLTVCGSGFTALTTNQPGSGNSIKWYNAPISGSLLATGTLFVTPVITQTTTYYVAEENSQCSSPRTPVVVTVSAPPAFAVNKPVLCGNVSSTMLTVTTDLSPYDTYIWSPVTNLYEDAALTIPYLGRNLTTVYAANLTPGQRNVICRASSFTSLCAATDTAKIILQPLTATISSSPAFICKTGSATLSLNSTTLIADGSVQWQESSDNSSFNDIPGATDLTYTTDVLTQTHYFRAMIRNADGDPCLTTASYTLTVSNPEITSFTNGNRCGSGTVTLIANADAGTINWYANQTGGASLGTGTSYTTPVLTASTTYYAAVTLNGCEGPRTAITVTITEATTLTLSAAQTVCNDGIAMLTVTGGGSAYDFVSWSPASTLYSDPAATVPYIAGSNASTVYARTTTAGNKVYTASASNSISLCNTTATTSVFVLPGSVTGSAASICNNGSTIINLSPATGYGNSTIQWQESSDNINFNTIAGENETSLTTTNLTATHYYRAQIFDQAGTLCTTVPVTVTVNSPVVSSANGNFRCGTGTVILTASAASGTIRWYADETGGSSLSTGGSFTTAVISTTTTYWVAVTVAGCQGPRTPVVATVNTPPALTIDAPSVSLNCASPMSAINVTSNIADFDSYTWSPATNLYLDAAATIPYTTGTSATTVYVKSTTGGVTNYIVTAVNGTTLCANTATSVVTVTSGTPVTVTASATVCNDVVTQLNVTSALANFSHYEWSPSANLYTDAAGTIPYNLGDNSSTVYFRSATIGPVTYTLAASNSGDDCISTDNTTMTVLPASATIAAANNTICKSGSTSLSLNAGGLTIASSLIQWQSSSDDINFVNVGSGGSTYNTGTITATTYYRAVIKNAADEVCFNTASIVVTVNNPSVTSSTGGSRCGNGVVTLSATSSAGATLNWYSSLTGGTVQGTGNTFTTPVISSTTNFYVAAVINGCISSPRIPVVASISSAPTLILTASQIACNNVAVPLSVISNQADYDSYLWSPAAGLYTDAAGLIPYVSGTNVTTVYARKSAVGSTTYTVNASNSTTSCATTATTSVAVQPASATAAATVTTICVSGTTALSLTPSSGYAAGSIQWQSSSDGISYSNIPGANSSSYTSGALTSTKYFQALINGGTGVCITTDPIQVTVNNPQAENITGGSRCGTGTVQLSASASTGTINWYSSSTGGTSLGSGPGFTTPVINSTTTYYVGVTVGSCEGTRMPAVATVTAAPTLTVAPSTQTICNNVVTPITVTSTLGNFDTYIWSPINNLFIDFACTIPYDGVSSAQTVYVKRSTPGTITYTCTATNDADNCVNTAKSIINVQPGSAGISSNPSGICISGTAVLSLAPASGYAANSIQWQTSEVSGSGFTDIFSATNPTYTTNANTTTQYYQAIIKDGTGATCFTTPEYELTYTNPVLNLPVTNNSRCGAGVVVMNATATNGVVTWYTTPTGGSPVHTGNTFTTPFLNATTIYYVSAENGSCSTERVADTATTATPPFLTVSPSQTVCNNTIAAMTVLSDESDYETYTWTPSANLFTDAAATIPYIAGTSATTVYAKTAIAGTTVYTINAINTTAGCVTSTTTSVSVQLALATISANPTSLCINGTAVLSLNPSSPYGVGSIQWERSPDGITWLGSPGAVGVQYTTPLQAETRYYRAQVKDGSGASCFTTSTFELVANNPQILGTANGTKCGTQAVTISATATFGSTLTWFANATGGTALATGNSFTTPVISATTVYYVQASVGSCLSARVPVTAIITPPPTLTLTSSQIACNGTITPLTITSNQASYETYTWSPVTNLYTDAAATIPYTSGTNASIVYYKNAAAGATTYTVTASNSVSQCVNTAATTITSSIMTVNVSSNPATVCIGGSAVITASGSGSYTYVWNPGNVSGAALNVTPASTGINTYSVTATDPVTGCVKNASYDLTVNALPDAPIGSDGTQSGEGVPVCQVAGGNTGQYRWYLVPTGGTAIPGETDFILHNYVINTTTTFYVSIFNGTCESLRTPVTENVEAVDPVTAVAASNPICLNGLLELQAIKTGSLNNYNYTWTATPTAGSGITTSVAGQTIQIIPTQAGTYIYKVSANDGPSNTSATISVTVNPLPAIDSIRASLATVCEGVSTTLNIYSGSVAEGPQTAPSGYPTPGTTTSTSNDNLQFVGFGSISNTTTTGGTNGYVDYTGSVAQATVQTGQQVSLTVRVGNGGTEFAAAWFDWNRNGAFETTEFVNVPLTLSTTWNGTVGVNIPSNAAAGVTRMRVRSKFSTALTSADASSTYSFGETEDYLVNVIGVVPQNSNLEYSWAPGDLTGAQVVVTPPVTTVYTVTITDPSTSCSKQGNITVTVNPIPAAPSNFDSYHCGTRVPECSVQSNTNSSSPYFNWYLEASGGTPIAGEHAATLTAFEISAPTHFYVSEVHNGCEGPRVDVFADVITPDQITAIVNNNSVCPNTTVTVEVIQDGGTNSYEYTWTATPSANSGIDNNNPLFGSPVDITPLAPGTYVYNVTATDPRGCIAESSVTVTVKEIPAITSATATPGTACEGSQVILAAESSTALPLNATIGVQSSTIGGDNGNPYRSGNGVGNQIRTQLLYTAAELTAAGFSAGPINGLGFRTTTTTGTLSNFSIRLGHTTATVLTSTYQPTPVNVVFTQASFTPVAGLNMHTFNGGSFSWDGTSNILVDICQTNSVTGTSTVAVYNPGFISNVHSAGSATSCSALTGTTVTNKPLITINGQVGTDITNTLEWVWTPGNLAGATQTINATATTDYTVTATNPATGCSNTSTVTVTVNPIPEPPVANNSVQCGYGVPTASVSTGGANGSFKWYSEATGGTLLQNGGSTYTTSIDQTTTFYVSELNTETGCESARTPVHVEVTIPDQVSATASAMVCINSDLVLTATNTAASPVNNYAYTWTASPATGSGISGTATGSPATVVPTTAGTYIYTVVAHDATLLCNVRTSITVTVNPLPVIYSATVTPVNNCAGGAFVLDAQSVDLSAPTTYALPGTTSSASSDNILLVQFGSIDNATTTGGVNGYVDYTNLTPASVNPGQTLNLTVHVNDGGTEHAAAWFDWNKNGVFDIEEFVNVPLSDNGTWTGTTSVTVPANAAPGLTHMRVRSRFSTALTASDAYLAYSFGETEEYLVNVSGGSAGAITWSWNPGGLTGNQVTVNPTTTTVYTVTATNTSTGCTNYANVTATVIPLNCGTINVSAVRCVGSPITLSSNATGSGTLTYNWSDGSATVYPNSASISPTLAAGTYTFTLTVTDPCGNSCTVSQSVVVNTLPTVTVSPDPANARICGTGSVQLTADGASTYTWLPANGLSSSTGAVVSASPTETTTYTVTGTDLNGCSNIATQTVVVGPAITVTPSVSQSTICSGESIQLAANSAGLSTTTVNNYFFNTSTAGVLDPMNGATTVVASGMDDQPMSSSLSVAGNSLALPFSFSFEGNNYTHFSASPDGWLKLGNSTAPATAEFNNITTSSANTPKIYAYWDDLATGTNGSVKTAVSGTSPNRIFVVEWNVTIPRSVSSPANSTFQAWLYEGSNNIEFRYGNMGATTTQTASVGVTGATASNFKSITVASNTASSTTAQDNNTGVPASGRLYSINPASILYSWTPANLLDNAAIANPAAANVTSNTTFTVVATEAVSGCSATGTVSVSVNQAPSFTACPSNILINTAAGLCTAVVNYSAIATGTPAPVLTYQFAGATVVAAGTPGTGSGSTFNKGVTTVTITATNLCGPAAVCTFTVTVEDKEVPVISCPAPITLTNTTGSCGAVANFTVIASDNCSGYTLTQTSGLPSGSLFPVGTTTNNFELTDASGNIATCSFTVTVNDTEKPTISCPSPVVADATNGICGAAVNYNITAADNCTGYVLTQTSGLPSGSIFPVGVTTNSFTVTDAAGNTATCSFTVTILDKQTPVVTCPASGTITRSTNNACAYMAASGEFNASATDNCNVSSLVYNLSGVTSGTGTNLNAVLFNKGNTVVTWTATDVSGNTSSCSFTVTVLDNQNPTIACPTPMTVNAGNGVCGAVVNYTVGFSDNCPGSILTQTAGLASGAVFPVGVTTNSFKVTDASGNISTCSFTVTVTDNQAPAITCAQAGTVYRLTSTTACTYTASSNEFNASASDNCSVASLTYTLSGATSGTGTNLNSVAFNNGITTVTWTATDPAGLSVQCSFIVSVSDKTVPVIACKPNTTRLVNPGGSVYTISGTELDPAASDNCGISTVTYTLTGATGGSGSNTLAGIDLNQGETIITWLATDHSGNASSCSTKVVVTKRNTMILYTGGKTSQYSDTTQAVATLYDISANPGNPASWIPISGKTITFTIGTVVASANTDLTGKATSTMIQNQAPRTYNIVSSFDGDANYTAASQTLTNAFVLNKENAVADYTGQEFASTGSGTSANVRFQATVRDTTAADPIGDPYAGDIRKAKARFNIRIVNPTNLSQVGTFNSRWLPVQLISSLDTKVGTALFDTTLNIGNNEGLFYEIKLEIDSFYTYRTDLLATMTVSQSASDYITGGGHLTHTPNTSAGVYRSNDNSHTNFAFNARFNRGGTNLRGGVNLIIRSGNLKVQVKGLLGGSNGSLGVNVSDPANKKATIAAKANMFDAATGLQLPGTNGATMTIKMIDKGEPGHLDSLSIEILANNGTLLYSSNFSNGVTRLMKIAAGNIQVNSTTSSGSTLAAPPIAKGTEPVTEPEAIVTPNTEQPFDVIAYPNPSTSDFKLQVTGYKLDQRILVRVIDINGRVLKQFSSMPGELIRLGGDLKTGNYRVEIIQNGKRKVVSLVKL